MSAGGAGAATHVRVKRARTTFFVATQPAETVLELKQKLQVRTYAAPRRRSWALRLRPAASPNGRGETHIPPGGVTTLKEAPRPTGVRDEPERWRQPAFQRLGSLAHVSGFGTRADSIACQQHDWRFPSERCHNWVKWVQALPGRRDQSRRQGPRATARIRTPREERSAASRVRTRCGHRPRPTGWPCATCDGASRPAATAPPPARRRATSWSAQCSLQGPACARHRPAALCAAGARLQVLAVDRSGPSTCR